MNGTSEEVSSSSSAAVDKELKLRTTSNGTTHVSSSLGMERSTEKMDPKRQHERMNQRHTGTQRLYNEDGTHKEMKLSNEDAPSRSRVDQIEFDTSDQQKHRNPTTNTHFYLTSPERDQTHQTFNAFHQYNPKEPLDEQHQFHFHHNNTTPSRRMHEQNIDPIIPEVSIGEGQLQRTQRICAAYLRGQLANVAKAAVWWSTFGVVAEALTKIPIAVGTTRLVFNLALVLVSPLAGTVAENTSIHALLNYTTWGRLLIWCCFIPASWIYFAVYLSSFTSFYICFLILMFIDGIQVSFANVVDIDCGGLDTLALQYKLSIGNYLRDRFNRIHQIVFDLSFILLTPPVAFLIWQIAFRYDHATKYQNNLLDSESLLQHVVDLDSNYFDLVSFRENINNTYWIPRNNHVTVEATFQTTVDPAENTDVAVLMIGICGAFGILSLYSLWSYWGYFSNSQISETVPQSSEVQQETLRENSSAAPESYWHLTTDRFRDVKDGFLIVLKEKPLGWRLLFLALETALEDAIVSVVIPQVALQMTPLLWVTFYPLKSSSFNPLPSQYVLPPILPGGWTFVNFIAVSLIAIGKSGGLASSAYMSARWTAPATIEKSGPYCKLFRFMFYSSASLLALPLAYFFLTDAAPFQFLFGGLYSDRTIDVIRGVTAAILIAIAGFLFFVFSTAPKIGFATLLHSLVIQRDIDPKVFGFVGTFVTITDAVIILALNLVFALCGPNQFLLALLISTGIYLLHGFAELSMGPKLILKPSSQQSNVTNSSNPDFPNLFRYNLNENQTTSVVQDSEFCDPRSIRGHRLSSLVLESSARGTPPTWNVHLESGTERSRSNALSALDPMISEYQQNTNENQIIKPGEEASSNREIGSWALSG